MSVPVIVHRALSLSSETPLALERVMSSETAAKIERAEPKTEVKSARRPYEKPAFIVSKAFERQALSCAGCLNQTSAFPAFCAMRS